MSRKLKKKKTKPFGQKPANISALFQDGLANHQAGKTREAANIYQKILQDDPNHSESLNLLGLIAQQDGDFKKAEKLVKKALSIRVDPGFLVVIPPVGTHNRRPGVGAIVAPPQDHRGAIDDVLLLWVHREGGKVSPSDAG